MLKFNLEGKMAKRGWAFHMQGEACEACQSKLILLCRLLEVGVVERQKARRNLVINMGQRFLSLLGKFSFVFFISIRISVKDFTGNAEIEMIESMLQEGNSIWNDENRLKKHQRLWIIYFLGQYFLLTIIHFELFLIPCS